MNRLRFRVVTGLLIALCVIALVQRVLEPLVPLAKQGPIAAEKGEFYAQGSRQFIQWYPYSNEAFQKARQSGKPILMVIGAPWSAFGRWIDRNDFTDDNVVEKLARNFICIRIDSLQDPMWLTNLMPSTRIEENYLSGMQIIFLDSNARIVNYVVRSSAPQDMQPDEFSARLNTAIQEYQKRLDNNDESNLQKSEVDHLYSTSSIHPLDFLSIAESLESKLDWASPPPQIDYSIFSPISLKYLWLVGRQSEADNLTLHWICSPFFDPVNGGFYRQLDGRSNPFLEFDKVTTMNASALDVLIQAYSHTKKPIYQWAARQTFDWMLSLADNDNLMAAAEVGDETAIRRSAYGSFSPAKLRDILSDEERTWVGENLNLNTQVNFQMTPYLRNEDVFTNQRQTLDSLLEKLRKSQGQTRKVAGKGLMDVNGSAVASMLRSTRCWPDPNRLRLALNIFGATRSSLLTASIPMHQQHGGMRTGTYLGDYVAYADAALEAYLITGQQGYFESGLSVLTQATKFYYLPEQRLYANGFDTQTELGPKPVAIPEILDTTREATLFALARLMNDYGALTYDRPSGRALVQRAKDIVNRFNWLPTGKTNLSSYYSLAARFEDDVHAFVVGPNAKQIANQLFQARPCHLVAPLSTTLRPDLTRRGAGIYVISGTHTFGPLKYEEAFEKLSEGFDLGLDLSPTQ